ncbi:MAG: VOC family protein [Pseudomonadota bacterium]
MSTEAGMLAWCDLSAYRPEVAKRFYSDLFGWSWSGGDYDFASAGEVLVAGVFQMPPKLKEMGMPSFWMSYIAVSDVAETVAVAKAQGGKVELEAADYALIRDPLGAGFTVHSGMGQTAPVSDAPGRRQGHGYFCSDLSAVTGFYEALFGWSFVPTKQGHAEIRTSKGALVASAQELPDDIRGKEQYWAVRFSVADLASATRTARMVGASRVLPTELPEGPALLVFDPDGAALFLVAP